MTGEERTPPNGIRTGRGLPDELIVSAEYAELIITQLRDDLRIEAPRPEADDISAQLGLARLKLLPSPNTDPTYLDGGTISSEKVLTQLQTNFKRSYTWAPPMAVNHVMNHVTMVGEVTFGGEGEVQAVGEVTFGAGSAPSTPAVGPNWPPRGSGPGCGVRIGVVDTALAPHPWIAGGWEARYSDMLHDSEPLAPAGHATFVTGLILREAPGAVVQVRRALGDDGSANAWDVANHIVSFGEAGVDVLNLSFVCYTSDGEAPLVLANAINRLQPGTVVVAAAGNLAPDTQSPGPAWPAAFDRVIAVGASDEHGRSAPFSPQAPWVDILSPGTNVTSTFLDGPVRIGTKSTEGSRTFKGFAAWSGTSFAAARVTGTIAAGVLPGRISARESLDNLLSTLDRFAGGAVIPRVLRTR